MESARADIIIISYNNSHLTENCLQSLFDSDFSYELNIIVVDNNSSDDTVQMIENNFPEVELIVNPENYGYAKAVNVGFSVAKSEIVIVANNDIIFQNETISTLVKYVENHSDIGAAGGQQYFPDGRRQKSYGDLPGWRLALKDLFFLSFIKQNVLKISERKEVEYIDGACIAIRRKAYDQVGGFDEDYFFYTEEADFCFKLKKNGWKVMFNPAVEFIHLRGSASGESRFSERNAELLAGTKLLFAKKNRSAFEYEMYYLTEKLNLNIKLLILKLTDMIIKNKVPKEKFDYFFHMNKYWKKI